MKTTIEFYNSTTNETTNTIKPTWSYQRESRYADQILKPEYRDRKLRFEMGVTRMRIVPALVQSAWSWMLGMHIQEHPTGRFVHPKTLARNSQSVFDTAYVWLKINHPSLLFSKENRKGARLLTNPHLLCWVIVEQQGKPVARLLESSGYDGSRGGVPGLGFQILKAAIETDADGKVVMDAVDPEAGCFIEVEKSQPPGAKFPSYRIRVVRTPAPILPLIQKMSLDEMGVICPLEEAIYPISELEQWKCLEAMIDPAMVEQIRGSEELVCA